MELRTAFVYMYCCKSFTKVLRIFDAPNLTQNANAGECFFTFLTYRATHNDKIRLDSLKFS